MNENDEYPQSQPQRSGPRKPKTDACVEMGDENLDGSAGRKGLCGHTGGQGAGISVKLIPVYIKRWVRWILVSFPK